MIEVPFLLRDAVGEWHELDPGSGSGLAPVLDLFRMTIAAVEVGQTGALSITFESGAELVVGGETDWQS